MNGYFAYHSFFFLQLTSYLQLLYAIRSIASVDLLLFSFSWRLTGEYHWCFNHELHNLKTCLQAKGKIYSEVQNRSSVFLSRIWKVRSEIHLTNSRTWYETKARNISQIFGNFCQLNSRYGLFKRFQSPAKKLTSAYNTHISLSFL